VHVLLVEDEPATRRGMAKILQGAGAAVTSAASAAEALAWLAEARPGDGVDVLLSDVGMPDADGYELIRRVRAGTGLGGGARVARLPAAALTAYARPEDRRAALAAGFDEHVSKPVEPAELIEVVARLAGRAGVQ
jgi:CheY-like chemotaxis protein